MVKTETSEKNEMVEQNYEDVDKNESASKEKVPIHINSDTMESDNVNNRVSFNGNVVASKGDMTIYADKMDIYTDETQKILETIIASGNVTIIRDEMLATCEEAIYEKTEEKLILTGEPVVTENENVIAGSKIVYYLEEENIEVLGGEEKKIEVILFADDIEKNHKKDNNNETDTNREDDEYMDEEYWIDENGNEVIIDDYQ